MLSCPCCYPIAVVFLSLLSAHKLHFLKTNFQLTKAWIVIPMYPQLPLTIHTDTHIPLTPAHPTYKHSTVRHNLRWYITVTTSFQWGFPLFHALGQWVITRAMSCFQLGYINYTYLCLSIAWVLLSLLGDILNQLILILLGTIHVDVKYMQWLFTCYDALWVNFHRKCYYSLIHLWSDTNKWLSNKRTIA